MFLQALKSAQLCHGNNFLSLLHFPIPVAHSLNTKDISSYHWYNLHFVKQTVMTMLPEVESCSTQLYLEEGGLAFLGPKSKWQVVVCC